MSQVHDRLERLLSIHKHQAYETHFFATSGLPRLFVGRHVLQPESSYVSKYLTRWLATNHRFFRGRRVLEIGCGSGSQSMAMAVHGAASVVSTDISAWAVESCAENTRRLGLQSKIDIRFGDMFMPIEADERFEFALFNHPFFCGRPRSCDVFEVALLDDRELAGVFLAEVWKHLTFGGTVIMPYSTICGSRNDPRRFARELSLRTEILIRIDDKDGTHVICAFSRCWEPVGCRTQFDIAVAAKRWREVV